MSCDFVSENKKEIRDITKTCVINLVGNRFHLLQKQNIPFISFCALYLWID